MDEKTLILTVAKDLLVATQEGGMSLPNLEKRFLGIVEIVKKAMSSIKTTSD